MEEVVSENKQLIIGAQICFYLQLMILLCFSLLMFGGEAVLRNGFLAFPAVFVGVGGFVYILPICCLVGLVISINLFLRKSNLKWAILSFAISIISAICLLLLYFSN